MDGQSCGERAVWEIENAQRIHAERTVLEEAQKDRIRAAKLPTKKDGKKERG